MSTNVRLAVAFEWDDKGIVGITAAGRLKIPIVPAAPGIYCFLVSDASGTELYIGESQDLRQRMLHNYTSGHGGKTTVRVRALLFQYLAERRSVRLAIAERAIIEVGGAKTPADLSEKSVRLLMENAALTLARRAGYRVHNLR